jgi:PBSX family phage terminase large subunit
MDASEARTTGEKAYGPKGGARELFYLKDPEVLLAGPAGTGKSRAALEKLNFLALKYPGFRGLIVRKTRESLQQSALVTFETEVLVPSQARYYSGKGEWRYRNGSVIVTGGLDKISKIMSSEYDVIYVQEATEISEDEWEHLTTRLRRATVPYQQIIGCCNPAGPNHWLKKRAEAGRLTLISSAHEDNPILYDEKMSSYTAAGTAYLAKLDALSGVRYQRLRLGLWVAAEGMVYEDFDWNLHVIERFSPPRHWPRYWTIDFGYTQPFCFQAWVRDEDDRLYRFAELYHTGMLVEEAALRIKEWMRRKGEDFPQAVLCDHDAEGRATLEKYLGVGTIAANKSVSPGLQAVMKRLKAAEDGKPRLFLMKEAALARDLKLLESKQPTSTEEEFELYLWQEGIKDSQPVKQHDHGLDALRYLCLFLDRPTSTSARAFPDFSASVHVRDGVSYQGGQLIVGLALGVGTTAMNVHEVRTLPDKSREIATLDALEIQAATAEVIAGALHDWKVLSQDLRVFAEPAGEDGIPKTGVLGALLRLGVRVETPAVLRNVPGRVHTVRTLLTGKDMYGKGVRYVCADSSPGLLRFIECLEKASWPTDNEGEVPSHPTSLATNRYAQHANAFSCAIEGYLRMPAVGLLPSAGGRPSRFGLPSDGRPMTAGLLNKQF